MLLLVILLLSSSLFAQADSPPAAQPPPPPPVCTTMDGFNDFDFWVGSWKVYSNDAARAFQGSNKITKLHQNCLVLENWTSAQGGEGSSMNYYDPVEKQWRQVWVAGGYSIDYSGGLDESGSMVLEGKINYYGPDTSFKIRGRWSPNEDGSVRQFIEQYDEENKVWNPWFDGLYVKE
jgi:hypothetical protein